LEEFIELFFHLLEFAKFNIKVEDFPYMFRLEFGLDFELAIFCNEGNIIVFTSNELENFSYLHFDVFKLILSLKFIHDEKEYPFGLFIYFI